MENPISAAPQAGLRDAPPFRAFTEPASSLGALGAEDAALVIASASDMALVLDGAGVIRDVAVNAADLSRDLEGARAWFGRPWLETVTEDSRAKVEAMMRDAAAHAPPRWRQVNQLLPPGGSVPILCAAVRFGDADRAVVFGRDLRHVSALQQRLVEAQQSVERDYAKLRAAETRYRLLFQVAPEPVLVVDAANGRLVEMNPAAEKLFGKAARRALDRPLPDAFDADGEEAVRGLLAGVRATGRADEVRARLAGERREVVVAASLMRQEGNTSFLVRLSTPVATLGATGGAGPVALPSSKTRLLQVVEGAPDAFVVTDEAGHVLTANAAFLEMAQLGSEQQAVGESLDRWLGRSGLGLEVLTAALRQRGSIRLFATRLHGDQGALAEVEVSAVSVRDAGGRPCFGFAIRDIGMRRAAGVSPREAAAPLRSVEQLTELIGRVPLKDLVREATDVIERLCIEAALQLTGDNRASAAEMLGLSRQSLYVKLRRYGLGDLDGDGGSNGSHGVNGG